MMDMILIDEAEVVQGRTVRHIISEHASELVGIGHGPNGWVWNCTELDIFRL